MIGAGTVLNPILKIATVVAILAAVSIFVVRPILDTTESVSDKARESSDRISRQAEEQSRKVQLDVSRRIALDAARSARIAGQRERARRIAACIERAGDDPEQMDFCRAL
jgi:hypothetical protein